MYHIRMTLGGEWGVTAVFGAQWMKLPGGVVSGPGPGPALKAS